MSHVRVEMLVEPFRESEPGAHVQAAIDALTSAGFTPDMGPFATTFEGPTAEITDALGSAIRGAVGQGATALQFRIEVARG